jgi:hypothetical protein
MDPMRLFISVVIAILATVHFDLLHLVSESLENLFAALGAAKRNLNIN